jgi:hypothetical protein|mmetsp:Transcript_34755/g.90648  ORF Transcript_34755/g.90648 Transcript_34755/m.90648 type:complete len:281 (+) Transcript_34755:81-923(+)
MIRNISRFVGISTLLAAPAAAQFGLGGKRKPGTQFQDLQDQAKAQQDGGDATGLAGLEDMDMDQLRKLMGDALNDPETQNLLGQMGDQFGTALEELSKMSPEEIEKQMEEAFKMMADSSMVDNILEKRDEVLAQLEASNSVPADELAKFKADPEYFELRMRESFDQMKNIFGDPDMMKSMTEAMGGMQELLGSQDGLLDDLNKILTGGDLDDDDKIEETRVKLLSGDFSDNPFLKEMLNNEEMKSLLSDPEKWRDSIKEGTQGLLGNSNPKAAGAGVGEL